MATTAIKLFLTQRMAQMAGAGSMRALREGLLWTVPSLMAASTFLVLAAVGQILGWSDTWVTTFNGLYAQIQKLLPLLATAAVGFMLAMQHRLPRLSVSFLCLTYLVMVQFLLHDAPRIAATLELFTAILSPLLTVPLIAWFSRRRWTRIAASALINESVRQATNLIIPGCLTAFVVCAAMLGLEQAVPALLPDFVTLGDSSPYFQGLLIAGLNSLLWFFGIHGYYGLQPLFDALQGVEALNAARIAQGLLPQLPLSTGFLSSFVFIGGAGSTASLSLAMLFLCRSRTLRLLALASLPMALLNVNEILLFGLPIILNWRLFVPFFLLPMANMLLALTLVQIGWVPMTTVPLSVQAPMLLNAFISTHGDWSAVMLQLLLVGFGMVIYMPFIRAIDDEVYQGNRVYLRSLDTTFTRLPEEASLMTASALEQAHRIMAEHETMQSHIQSMSDCDFFLEYQPKVALKTGVCIGCEALIRMGQKDGSVQEPSRFLPWLRSAGLIQKVDLWVAQRALEQTRAWAKTGLECPIAINVSGSTLVSNKYFPALLNIVSQARGRISLEIVEEDFIDDVPAVSRAIDQLHAVGVKIAMDDFGVGYSSMSYLHQLDIDTIKIDRSFVLAQASERGAVVMGGLLRFCETLDLEVVIEGVETQAQLDALPIKEGVIIQGWYFSKALSTEHFERFARTHSAANFAFNKGAVYVDNTNDFWTNNNKI